MFMLNLISSLLLSLRNTLEHTLPFPNNLTILLSSQKPQTSKKPFIKLT